MTADRLPKLLALFLVVGSSARGADLTIVNTRAPGFNDSTPVAPLALNFGTTRGQQALIVFQATAAMWGAAVQSSVPILIDSEFNSVTTDKTFACTTSGAVLAYTTPLGAVSSANFPNPQAAYIASLANALSGHDLFSGAAQFVTNINGDLGTSKCDLPLSWYFGLDTNIPSNAISLFTTLLHEFGHGLGFFSFLSTSTGNGSLSIFDYHIFDVDAGVSWATETPTQRVQLIGTPDSIGFDGPAVRADIPTFLAPTPTLVTTFGGVDTQLNFVEGQFSGPLVGSGPLVATVPLDACNDLSNAAAVNGKFALIERSLADAGVVCSFLSKAERAADAGAIGVIVFDYTGENLIQMSGTPALAIPAAFISKLDGNALQSELATGPGPVTAGFGTSPEPSNTDKTGTRVLLYTPTEVTQSSSVSHWNANSYPHNLLLQYAVQPDIRLNMDFTPDVMSDLGWSVVSGLGVSLVKLLDPEVPAGAPFRYLIAVLNRRTTPIDNVTLNLTLPAGTAFISNTSSPAGCATAFPCNLGQIQAGEVLLVVTAVQASSSPPSPFIATATLTPSSSNANDNLTATSSQTVATGGDVQVTVTGPNPATPGTTATLTTTVTNLGPGDAAEVRLNGTLGGSGASPPVFASNAGQCVDPFPCDLGTIPRGTSVTVNTAFTVPSGFQNGTTFTLSATSSTPDSNGANNTATFTFSTGATDGGSGGSSSSGGCSSTGGSATMLGLLGLALALLVRRRGNTF